MAHIYSEGVEIGKIAEILRLMLQMEDTAGALQWFRIRGFGL